MVQIYSNHEKVFDGFEEFIEDYQRDEYGSNTSELINDFYNLSILIWITEWCMKNS